VRAEEEEEEEEEEESRRGMMLGVTQELPRCQQVSAASCCPWCWGSTWVPAGAVVGVA
jgi:hypothetical protein